MSKIICDVCGTSFPETANQCPICGCVRTGEAKTVAGDTNADEVKTSGTYTYVKGGRFSKSNVRKRNRENQIPVTDKGSDRPSGDKKVDKKDKGLTIAVVVLLLAVIAVVLYIMIRVFGGGLLDFVDSGKNTTGPSVDGTTNTVPSTSLSIPCTGLTIDNPTPIDLRDAYLLNVTVVPADTTDDLIFISDNENIAKVSEDGVITAVGTGETNILVICGSVEIKCQVVCNVEDSTEPSDPTEPTEASDPTEPTEPIEPSEPTEPSDPSEPTVPAAEFSLNREDFTLDAKGASWMLYDGSDPEKITWSSDDSGIATIENGKVVAVAPGTTTVYGEYNGLKRSCIVRCSFTVSENTEPETQPTPTKYKLSDEDGDATIEIGQSFYLYLLDENGKAVGVTWTAADSCCSVNGNQIIGNSNGVTKVSTVYEGVEYSCIVRVCIRMY